MYSLNAFKILWETSGSQGNTLHVGKILSIGDPQTGRVLDCTVRSGMFESLPRPEVYIFMVFIIIALPILGSIAVSHARTGLAVHRLGTLTSLVTFTLAFSLMYSS